MKGVKNEAMVAAKSAAILISLLTIGVLTLGVINSPDLIFLRIHYKFGLINNNTNCFKMVDKY
jgi:hypothetical protein